MNGFPKYEQPSEKAEFMLLILSEFLFFVDIVINFFLQELDEEGHSKYETL